MTLYAKPGSLFLIAFFFFVAVRAQDLYDLGHRLQYAHHLQVNHRYLQAATEYKNIQKAFSVNDSLLFPMLHNYRKANACDSGIVSIEKSGLKPIALHEAVCTEYLKLLLECKDFGKSSTLLRDNIQLDSASRNRYLFYSYLLQDQYSQARLLYNSADSLDYEMQSFRDILMRAEHLPHKSAGFAMAMSAIVPGSGKLYTGEWKDGLVAFATIGILSYESYIGFHKRGTKSVLGWVYGGLAFGFYAGNIYGSFHSAKHYNQRQRQKLHNDAEHRVYSTF